MSWKCEVCGKRNPDERSFCGRKHRRQSCYGFSSEIGNRELRRYIAFLTIVSDL